MDREELIAGYAAGTLHPALRMLVDCQSAIDAESARESAVAVAAGGAFLEQETPADLRSDALERALAKLDSVDMEPAAGERAAARGAGAALAELKGVPDPALDLAIEAASSRGWRRPMKGLQRLELMRDGRLTAELIRVEGGVGVPEHGHGGREYTLCLEGAFRQDGRTYGRGDLVIAGGETVHAPRAEPGEDVLVLAVTEAPLRYRGLTGLLQKILGFR